MEGRRGWKKEYAEAEKGLQGEEQTEEKPDVGGRDAGGGVGFAAGEGGHNGDVKAEKDSGGEGCGRQSGGTGAEEEVEGTAETHDEGAEEGGFLGGEVVEEDGEREEGGGGGGVGREGEKETEEEEKDANHPDSGRRNGSGGNGAFGTLLGVDGGVGEVVEEEPGGVQADGCGDGRKEPQGGRGSRGGGEENPGEEGPCDGVAGEGQEVRKAEKAGPGRWGRRGH